jgi:hypothetical protein
MRRTCRVRGRLEDASHDTGRPSVSVSQLLDDLDSPHADARQAARAKLCAFLENPVGAETVGSLSLSLARSVDSERTATSLTRLLARLISVRDLGTLLESGETTGWTHSIARMTVRRWFEEANYAEAAEGASVCVLWAAQSGDETLAEFVCDVILKRATARPHSTFRAVLPILQQVANQRRLKRLRRGLGAFRAIQQDKPFGETFVALEKLLPLRDLPIPSGSVTNSDALPIPSHDAEVSLDDLPTPTVSPEKKR